MKPQIGTTTQAQPRVPDQLVGFRSVNRDMAAFESLGAKDPIEPWWFRDPLAEDWGGRPMQPPDWAERAEELGMVITSVGGDASIAAIAAQYWPCCWLDGYYHTVVDILGGCHDAVDPAGDLAEIWLIHGLSSVVQSVLDVSSDNVPGDLLLYSS